ncbi:hypothetical protein WMY93_029539 [Mugilogobius chulae]|uniref:Uncharacterized protein n=1 Tax=Mugilogobius chulae TaxID=88201 RepID=A0AAW0MLB7_9GOBI
MLSQVIDAHCLVSMVQGNNAHYLVSMVTGMRSLFGFHGHREYAHYLVSVVTGIDITWFHVTVTGYCYFCLVSMAPVIQTISAVDRDEPLSGHRFYFSLAAPVASNLNFTLRDNKDNTASILTKRGGFRRREQPVYLGLRSSSTNTLSVRVCECDSDGVALSCGAIAYTSTGLSTGALMAILGCIITLLEKPRQKSAHTGSTLKPFCKPTGPPPNVGLVRFVQFKLLHFDTSPNQANLQVF